MTANNDYWVQRTRANAEKAEKQAASYARRLKSVQKRAAEEIDRYLADLLLDISSGGTPTRTQLWTAGKYLKLRDCIQQQCADVGQRQRDLLDELLPKLFDEILETNLADFKAADSPFSFLPTRMIRQSLDTAWSGQNYSSRIWKNTTALAERLEQDIADYIVLGKSRTQITAAIRDDFKVSYSKADRLFRTESAHVMTEASKESYKRANIKQVKIIHGKNHCDCDICNRLDGQVFNIDTAPLPPFHCNCICCIAPVVNLNTGGNIIGDLERN